MNPQDDDTTTRAGLWVVFTTVAVLLISVIIWVLKGIGTETDTPATLEAEATPATLAQTHDDGAAHAAAGSHAGNDTASAEHSADAAASAAQQAAEEAEAQADAATQAAADAARSTGAQAADAKDEDKAEATATAAAGDAQEAAADTKAAESADAAASQSADSTGGSDATTGETVVDEFIVFDDLSNIDLAAAVHFASASFALPSDAGAELVGVVDALKANESRRVLLAGYHDPTGNAEFNKDLARKRAFAVRDSLVAAGISPERIVLRKPEQTAGTGTNAEARRVELRLLD